MPGASGPAGADGSSSSSFVSFTSSRPATGRFLITFAQAQANAHYRISLTTLGTHGTSPGDDFMIAYTSKSTTGFQVIITEQDNGTAEGVSKNWQFDFICVKQGAIFCNGSVQSYGVKYPDEITVAENTG